MSRFLLFVGLLVAAAYLLTAPPQRETALGANEAPLPNDKPLLTSWGPTLGSLRTRPGEPGARNGAGTQTAANETFHQYGPKTELWVLGQSNGFKDRADPAAQDRGWVSDGYVENSVIAAAAEAATEAERAEAERAKPAVTTVAAVVKPDTSEHAKPSEPVIDRIAAARPPQRRGLFTRTAAVEPRATDARRGTRNRGLFARLIGRNKPAQHVFALGPAR